MVKPQQSPVPDEGLVDALVRASFVTTAVLNRLGADNDVSLTLLRVIGILRDRRLRMVALADYLGLEKSTMTGLIDRAEKRGIVARAPSAEDGRAIDVFLTKQGAELVERMYVQVQQALAPLTERLNTADQQRLQALLLRMLDAADD
ncbi:MarR family transcriptional regulator [Myxococcus stipitatus]|uniref:MarR family winged helix-turn-helix transcriptional regulator n=1 Tax=Myxococcus stipitatus TaxID=83455 RepID=UPI001F273DAC|nr:MarR family transcriptional regulator [Myxococcus stipitatus]MCE9669987.1 MarR family transcriptional regulator [Myxococcus stipitatus]